MEPFLKIIAEEYSRKYPDLTRICFLFPNKRCGVFLKKYLGESGKHGDEMPHIHTISEFMSQITRKTEAGKIVQLFTLFNSYKSLFEDSSKLDFDEFRGWGEIVLGDFNTVDFYMANPEEIFKNVNDYREITSNFLTEEQKEVMREYFGLEEAGDSKQFWKNFDKSEENSLIKERFLNLWQILLPLYNVFYKQLEEKGLSTAGHIYRMAAQKLAAKGKSMLPYKKIVVVGFNALTEAERLVFKTLRDTEGVEGFDSFADFIWDNFTPLLKNEDFNACRFVEHNIKHFPSPEWFENSLKNHLSEKLPEIEILSAPSLTAQAKLVTETLKKYAGPSESKQIRDAKVALVLPDESLLSNILYSIPDEVGDINLTMGLSLRNTSISSFMVLLRRLYATSKEIVSKAAEPIGETDFIYFSRDLKLLLSHPYTYFLCNETEIESLLDYIRKFHKITVNINEIERNCPSLVPIISFPSKKEGGKIWDYLKNLFDRIITELSSESNNSNGGSNPDIDQVTVYKEYVESLEEAVRQFDIKSSALSLMQMCEKVISTEKIGFEGEPLTGLQVMGVLETRVLDFKEVIILSMNEGIMPGKSFAATFIPETLRKAYGLPPARYSEELFAYYFYRLISRAEKVTLVYDGRSNSGMRGGESRYLLQLKEYYPKSHLKEETWQYRLQQRISEKATIIKTPQVKELLKSFMEEGENKKNFSASSLNNYRECQVKFFIQNVLDISSDPEREEYMDAIAIGDVLHHSMLQLYLPDVKLQRRFLKYPVIIDEKLITNLLENKGKIRSIVEESIKKLYYKNEEKDLKIESGVINILTDQIGEMIEEILKYDLSLTPFKLIGSEIDEKLSVKLKSGKKVNFRFAIDRLDEIEVNGDKHLRIVDYKTGKRKRKADSLSEIFEGGSRNQQIFQLFTYAWLLGKSGIKNWEEVITEIYFVPDLIKGERGLPEIGKEKVESFKPYYEDFSKGMENLIDDIFDSEEFKECEDVMMCHYCSFRSFCRK